MVNLLLIIQLWSNISISLKSYFCSPDEYKFNIHSFFLALILVSTNPWGDYGSLTANFAYLPLGWWCTVGFQSFIAEKSLRAAAGNNIMRKLRVNQNRTDELKLAMKLCKVKRSW